MEMEMELKMNAVQRRRLVGYPIAAGIVGTLLWAGFVREVEADIGTSIQCAEMQIGLAASMVRGAGAAQGSGDLDKAREIAEAMLIEAEGYLDAADRVDSAVPRVAILRGDVCSVRGDVAGCGAWYRKAAGMPQCSEQGRVLIEIRLADMLAEAGDPVRALETLSSLRTRCESDTSLSQFETDLARVEYRILRRQDDLDGAANTAARLAQRGGIDAIELAGELFEDLGDVERAAEVYAQSALPSFVSNYCRARLKARAGDHDTALELLASALHDAREDVLARVQSDRRDWAACRGNTRFEELVDQPSQAATPAR